MAWFDSLSLVFLFYTLSVCLAAIAPAFKDILMRGAHPTKPDAYLCTGYVVEEEETYVVRFEALANADTAHHILMYGCQDGPASQDKIWDCPPICSGGPQQIMFAWAKNAPPTQLPDGVGFRIGKTTSIRYIVMQIHYAKSFSAEESSDKSGIRLHITQQKQPNVAGIFLMLSYGFSVPPNNPKYHVDISCRNDRPYSMFPFAYRTHAHGLGTVISGYQYNSTGYHMIGKGNPQWPQAFYPANSNIEIKPEDNLVARCTYNSTGMDHTVNIGATGNDEMCNFYIMFYTNSSVREPSSQCGGVESQSLVDNLPADSDVTLPPNPLLDEEAHGHHHHHSMGASATEPAVPVLEKSTDVPHHQHQDTSPTAYKDILMRGAHPDKPDAYLCTSYAVEEEETYVVRFEALANADTAHHILMYGCQDGPASPKEIWDCPPICSGGPQQIMFAWAKNAPPTQLPDGVGFRIGKTTSIRYIVMQIHYAKFFSAEESPDKSGIRLHVTQQKQPNVAGIFLMMSFGFSVPPNNPKYHVDISCRYNKPYSMFPFAYRTHAHGLGTVISGYQYNNTGYHMIGKGNPQWPQAFYPANSEIEIKPEDNLVARCTYNSTGMDHTVNVGSTGNDEMCNFYIMFYTDSSVREPSSECGGVESQRLVDNLPADSDVTLPPNPLLDEEAHGHHHHHSMGASATEPAVPVLEKSTDVPHHQHQVPIQPLDKLVLDVKWPQEQFNIGQVGGVATDSSGNVYVFHRGSRVWDSRSFDFDNNFTEKSKPISEDVIMIFTREGKFFKKFGAGRFYMPHGIAVDGKGNIWLTDVALHQVLRIPAGKTEPDLTLGEKFVHGDDAAHFCKPTDIAVLDSGDFYVSDGYCNSRILKFSKDGNLLKQIRRGTAFGPDRQAEPSALDFAIPHSVTVAEDKKLLFVADRENGRIVCLDLEGSVQYIIRLPEFGSRLFAVEYCPQHGGLLFAVNGPSFDGEGNGKVAGFTMRVSSEGYNLQEVWNLPSKEGLQNPHDVAVDVKGHAVYVGELNPNAVWKFVARPNTTSTVKPAIPTVITASPSTTSSTGAQKLTDNAAKNVNNILPKDSMDKTLSAGTLDLVQGGTPEEVHAAVPADFTSSIIIGVLLVIPVVLLLVITIIMRMHKKSCDGCLSGMRKPKVFTLQGFLGNSHKGFDKLSQDDSDHDADVLSDSDNEEFRQPVKNKA